MSITKKNILIIVIVLSFALLFSYARVEASCGNHVVTGYAWSDNIGWIDFACTSSEPDFGVDINNDNYVSTSSYAWSDNIGWITFDPAQAGTPPSGGYDYTSQGYLAKLETSTNPPQLRGWARALSHGGGWDGWINLYPNSGSSYGVTLDSSVSPKEFQYWAWGSDVVGWLSFNCKTGGNNSSNICNTSNYAVFFKNRPPYITDSTSSLTRCNVAPATELENLSWKYNDADGDYQSDYEIVVDDNSDFSSPVIDCTVSTTTVPVGPGDTDSVQVKVVSSPSSNCTGRDDSTYEVSYNTTYYWHVRVKDGSDWSDWSPTVSFTTDPHAYPWVDWTYDPQKVSVDEVVSTTNNSICYDSSNNSTACNWLWTVNGNSTPDGTWEFASTSPTSTATSKEPSFIFKTSTTFAVDLKATDPSDYSCNETHNIHVNPHLPRWKEVKP